MDLFEQASKQIDAEFDAIMEPGSGDEPVPVVLIRAAAKLIMTTYPGHNQRTMALADLFSSARHLKTLEEEHV
jgi:hypothetical protein